MTVKELKVELDKLNPDAAVIMSSDAEGNTFNALAYVEEIEGEICLWPSDEMVDNDEEWVDIDEVDDDDLEDEKFVGADRKSK